MMKESQAGMIIGVLWMLFSEATKSKWIGLAASAVAVLFIVGSLIDTIRERK